MSITAEEIVELFRKDIRARKMFAELLVIEPDMRLVLINAILRDVATKQDIEKLKDSITRLGERIDSLNRRINSLDKRIDSLDKRIDTVTKISWATLIAIIGTLIAIILQPLLGG